MAGDVIVTVALDAALHVSYAAGGLDGENINPVSRPSYRAGGRGVTAARVLHSFGHDVLAAGLAGGTADELIRDDLARSGVPTAFTMIRGESRRIFRIAGPGFPVGRQAARVLRFGEPGPYITTEELGRFAADYRSLLTGAAAMVLCGTLPDGLPAETYGTLVTYAAEAGVPVILDAGGEELKHAVGHGPDLVVATEAGVPVILDAGGEELKHAVGHGPDLVVAETGSADPGLGPALIRLGAGAAAVATGNLVRAVTAAGEWTARLAPEAGDVPPELARGALVAGLVPGQLLGWSWPDRLRHALALAMGGTDDAGPDGPSAPGRSPVRDHVDLAVYERLLAAVTVEPPA